MGYSEKDGQVVLTLSREDYHTILMALLIAGQPTPTRKWKQILNRLNQGNPNYTPYQVGERKVDR
jgi:hypothetical protein